MIELLSVSLFLLAAVLGWGSLFQKITCMDEGFGWPLKGVLGLFFLSFLALMTNFFLPISQNVSFVLLVPGILCSIAQFVREPKSLIHSRTVAGLLLLFLIAGYAITNNQYSDVNAYHFPTVHWIQHSKLVLGLGNLQDRFAFNSLWHMASAVTNPFLRLESSNDYASVLLLFLFFCSGWFVAPLIKPISWILRTVVLVIWGKDLLFLNLGLPATDLPAALITILFLENLLTWLLVPEQKMQKRFLLIAFLFFFAVQVKLSQIFLFIPLLGVLWAKRRDFQRKQLAFIFLSGVVMVGTWLFRSILVSGCLVFPSQATCFPQLPWAIPLAQVQSALDWIYAWPRLQGVSRDQLGPLSHWFPFWWDQQTTKKYFLLWLGSFVVYLFFKIKMAYATASGEKDLLSNGAGLLTTACGLVLLCWFLQAPDIRFISGVFIFMQSVFFYDVGRWLSSFAGVKRAMTVGFLILSVLIVQDFGRIALQSCVLQPLWIERYANQDRFIYRQEESRFGVQYKVPTYLDTSEAGCWLEQDLCSDVGHPNLRMSKKAEYLMFSQDAP